MALDTWLTFCGRLPEICDGRKFLLRRTPALIQIMMDDFDYEFRDLDRMEMEGGSQIIKNTAKFITDELEKSIYRMLSSFSPL